MAHPPLSNSHGFFLAAPCARVFPFFTAEGEKAWASGWNPEMLSGNTERGSAFRTRSSHDGRETVWIVSDYRPDQFRVTYARIALGSNIGLVDVACREAAAGARVEVTYTLTGLDSQGDEFVRGFLSEAHYRQFIDEWRAAIAGALGTE